MQVEKMSFDEVSDFEKMIERIYGTKIKFNHWLFKVFGYEIYIVNKEIASIDINVPSIMSLGLSLGKIKGDRMQLTVEGSQIIGKTATINIAIIDEKNLNNFLQGMNFSAGQLINCDDGQIVLIKFKDYFVGCGLLNKDTIKNVLPKSKRIFSDMRKI